MLASQTDTPVLNGVSDPWKSLITEFNDNLCL